MKQFLLKLLMCQKRNSNIFQKIFLLSLIFSFTSCTHPPNLGNTLRVAVRAKFRSMDPVHGSDYYSDIEIMRAYEGLFHYHYLKRPYTVEPLLAESMPEISKDKKTYTIRLKKGVFFQDDKAFAQGKGKELTSQDVIYSLSRLADPKNLSEGWWILNNRIAGLNAWREKASQTGKASYDDPITGLQAIDRYTVKIRLTKPCPLFMHFLAMPYTSIVAREVVEYYQQEFGSHPIGTGPFVLESSTPAQLIWKKNQNYRLEFYPETNEKIPFIDRIVDDIIVPDQPAWLNFIQGRHDYLMKIPSENINNPKITNHEFSMLTSYEVGFVYNVFNMDDPVVGGNKNKFLRQAMALAYDEKPTINTFYLGLAVKAHSPVPPEISGYDPTYQNPFRAYDLAKAREILKKAGHPNGQGIPEITYDTISDTRYRHIAEYFQMSMAKIGIKIKINASAWPEYLSRIRKKQIQIAYVSCVYDYPDAESGYQLLYGKNESPGQNEANYKNPYYDALYEKAVLLPDGLLREQLFKKMRNIFVEDVPWIITLHRKETRLMHPWVKNYKIHAFEYNTEKYLKIDVTLRNKTLY